MTSPKKPAQRLKPKKAKSQRKPDTVGNISGRTKRAKPVPKFSDRPEINEPPIENKTETSSDLRKKALKKLSLQSSRLDNLSKKGMKHLVTELGTHQIELEMQNEELQRADTEIVAAQTKYSDFYDFSPLGYFTFDRKGLIQDLNLTGATMLGTGKSFLRGQPFQTFIEPTYRSIFSDHLQGVFAQETSQTCEIAIRKKGGSTFHVQLHSLSFNPGDGGLSVCRTAVSDVTERKRTDDHILALNENLNRQNAELAVLNKELDAFSFAVSHDLRAPLRHIDGFIRILAEDYAEKLDETGKDYIRRVQAGAERMKHLIDALLGLSRFTRNELNRSKVYLSALGKTVADDLTKLQPERRVEFVIADNMMALGDQNMLRAAIDNLLGNAWKFTEKRPVAKIEFGVTQIDGKDVFFVKDNGAGFNMKFSEKLYTPFQRLHQESEFSGLGIGLSIVQRIVHRHGGRVWAEGDVDKGAIFYFTLP
jgi:PAS domain S-box-containing protein